MAVPTLSSRLLSVFLTTDREERVLFEIRRPMPRSRGIGIRRVRLVENTTLHDVAFDHYGDQRLWWAIAEFNNIFDPTSELETGREIFVPPIDAIERYLGRTADELLG